MSASVEARASTLVAPGWVSSMPIPEKTGPTFPTACTGPPAACSTWSQDRPGGGTARSRRPVVRSNAPGSPTNGRAITRPTACSPVMISRAAAQAA